MKTFKYIDLRVQVFLALAGIAWGLSDPSFYFCTYFAVGGWQLLSCGVHALCRDHFLPVNGRRRYLQVLGWTFFTGVVSLPVVLIFLAALLFVSPVLAIWYASICYAENRLLDHKMLIHLKR